MKASRTAMLMIALVTLAACEAPNINQNPRGLAPTSVFIERALDNYNVGQPQATINPQPSADLDEDDPTTGV